MADEFQPGDVVTWNFRGGKIRGKVVRKLVSPYKIGSKTMQASEDNPEYLVESLKTGKQAVHKPTALSKI